MLRRSIGRLGVFASRQKRIAIERGKLVVNRRRRLRDSKYGTGAVCLKEISGRDIVLCCTQSSMIADSISTMVDDAVLTTSYRYDTVVSSISPISHFVRFS